MDDGLFYTVRYYSYDQGQYQYMNVSDHQVTLDKLQPDTDYYFEVRSMNPPYLSDWSDQARNRTRGMFVLVVVWGGGAFVRNILFSDFQTKSYSPI